MLSLGESRCGVLSDCPVRQNIGVAPGYCRLTLKAPSIIEKASPGQFVMAHVPGSRLKMLPRPLSIFGVDRQREELSLFFAVKGQGTALLAAAGVGSVIKLHGPLGRGFPPLRAQALMVAGGMGIAPIAFLAASTRESRTLIYGARSADQLVCPPADLAQTGLTVLEVTDDGSRGERGNVIKILRDKLPGFRALYACGPRAMLKGIASISIQYNIPAWISLEEKMACGIGACLGCPVESKNGYRPVCSEGPVFPVGEVIFND